MGADHRLDVVELMDLCRILDLDVAIIVAEVRDEAGVGRRRRRQCRDRGRKLRFLS